MGKRKTSGYVAQVVHADNRSLSRAMTNGVARPRSITNCILGRTANYETGDSTTNERSSDAPTRPRRTHSIALTTLLIEPCRDDTKHDLLKAWLSEKKNPSRGGRRRSSAMFSHRARVAANSKRHLRSKNIGNRRSQPRRRPMLFRQKDGRPSDMPSDCIRDWRGIIEKPRVDSRRWCVTGHCRFVCRSHGRGETQLDFELNSTVCSAIKNAPWHSPSGRENEYGGKFRHRDSHCPPLDA